MHDENSSLLASETLYRRIARDGDTSMLVTDEATGERRISSGAFVMDVDGCSVYLHGILEAGGMGPSDLVVAPLNVVISLSVGTVRGANMDVRPDAYPSDSDGHPRDAAHALIVNPHALSKKRRITAFRQLAAASTICVTPT